MFSPWTTVQAASGGISVVPGLTFGYLPLNVFGGNTTLTLGDNGFENISVPGYLYAGQTYTTLGITANGFLVVGGATAADLASVNQNLPDTAVPNNVLAPFWTDLNPGNGGRILINVLTDGVSSWIVVEWERVPDATDSSQVNTFQIWIGVNGTQDVSFTYGVVGSGADGLLTVGAENADGSSGQAVFYNGAGTLPAVGTDLRVMYTPDTATPTATNTPINTPTNTPVPPTNTPTSTPTNTPVPPTNTPTSTPTNTATPTNTPTITPVPIPSCNGRTATISVKNGKIVGGPDAGKTYTGTLNGTIGNDVIVGTEGTDTVDAKAGNDTICGLAGDDKLTADAGDDYVDGGRGNDTLKGSSGTDLLLGGDNDDALDGDDGNDTLIGGAGNDFLDGDKHNDTLTGGSGKDTFKGGDGTDTATDVNASEDDTTSSIP